MVSLELEQVAIAACNPGPSTLIPAIHHKTPILLSAARDRIDILNEHCQLERSLPFELAFPIHSHLESTIEAVAFDFASNRIAASSNGRIAVWQAAASSSWRVHSSFTVSHSVSMLDFAQGRIVAGGDAVSFWAVDESSALPRWTRIGFESQACPILAARLSPSAQILASVKTGSSLVRLSSVLKPSSSLPNALRFRSHASHSLRIRSLSWRPTDDPADSGPILFTTTLDGVFRIWGCMIDEPHFFSLWATLDVHSSLPMHVPLATCFKATKEMWPLQHGEEGIAKRGTKDEFVTVFSDGSVHLTTVTNFDCRPPTCLSQSTVVVQGRVFQQDQLANLRYTILLPSSPSSFTLVARCSRGTLIRVKASIQAPFSKTSFPEPPSLVAVNLTGRVQRLIPTFCGEAALAFGDNGRIQNWELGDDEVVTQTFVSEPGVESCSLLATWHDGRMIAIATSDGLKVFEFRHSGRLHLLDHLDSPLACLSAFFVARTNEDSPSTTIVAVTSDFTVVTWTYAHHKLELGSTQSLVADAFSSFPTVPLSLTVGVPIQSSSNIVDEVSLLAVDNVGTLTFWTATIPDSSYRWRRGPSVRTGKADVTRAACNAEFMSALVSKAADGTTFELSIWDSKSSEFASGLQFSQEVEEEIIDLDWSFKSDTLAMATRSRIDLLCAQRLDDLTGSPSWVTYASISLQYITAAPVSAVCWLATGLAAASGSHLFFYSSKLESGEDCHKLAACRTAPLPYHHPQLLFQALLHGHMDVVFQVLAGLASQLTEDGDSTPIGNSSASQRITIEDFLRTPTPSSKGSAMPTDIFLALTAAAVRDRRSSRHTLTEDATNRLVVALKKCSLRGLSNLEHAHLSVLVQTVFEIQRQQGSLDSNGLRYLISMRSFFIYNSVSLPSSTVPTTSRLKYRDVVWAFHSESQDLLLDESVKACEEGKLTWENAKALGVFLWLKSPEVLSRQLELVGRTEYSRPDRDDKDPITATLFYLALRKKHIAMTLWKQAGGHADQRSMLKFLVNDFELPRWRSAALKNAFALLSKQRFLFAAAFFLLGNSLKDAVNVCLRQLDDFQLAIAITRVHEGDNGPVLRVILEETVLPLAFKQGFRWLASWSFWMLNRRDLAIQTIVTPLADLATRLPYKLVSVGSPMHEDPCLVLLFAQLRSKSLQTVKGAIAVPGRTEFNFVLHMSRVLCRMGCHALALSLVQSYEFIPPEASQRPSSQFLPRRSLRRMSTVMDMELPSNLASRAPSPVPEGWPAPLPEAAAGGSAFREVLKKARVETKGPAEFSFDAFNF